MIATVSPSSANCEHTINTLRYADRVKELKGPSNLGSEEIYKHGSCNNKNANETGSSELKSPNNFRSSVPIRTTMPKSTLNTVAYNDNVNTNLNRVNIFTVSTPITKKSSINDINSLEFDSPLIHHDSVMKDDSSPLKLTESDDSFLLSTFSSQSNNNSKNSQAKSRSATKLRESLHHSIAVLYDRVSNCTDEELLELLEEELEGLLAAFNK